MHLSASVAQAGNLTPFAATPCFACPQGSTWYSIDDTNFFAELLSKYNRTHLAGPSGSAVLLHTLFFDLLG